MNWTMPAVMQSIINLIVLATIGLAAMGKLRDGRFRDQQELIKLRGEQIESLEDRIKDLKMMVDQQEVRFKQHADLSTASEESLRAEISELQRLNFKLQKQLDRQSAAKGQ